MAKSVFRPNEVSKAEEGIVLKPVRVFEEPVEEVVDDIPEYTGPTADDLKREAEAFKVQWEEEKNRMLAEAQNSADQILKNAESAAFQQVKKQSDAAAVIKNNAEKEARETIQKAQEEANEILAKARSQETEIFEKAQKDGFEKGHEEGYQFGNAEANRLIDRLHTIIDSVQNKRQEILDSTEGQIVELVILMTRKVVKVMSDSQKSVIMSNVVQALKKVKGRGDITLRVNLQDVKLTTQHITDFVHEVENIRNVTVVEDSSVERGGCIVETDFGAIDARISSQLGELESKVLEVSPIKTVNKADVINPDA